MKHMVIKGALISALVFSIYKLYKPAPFSADQLKTIRMENERFSKLIDIMHEIKINGLKQAMLKHIDQKDAEAFIEHVVFEGFSKANSRLCECKIPQMIHKTAQYIFKNKYDETIDHKPIYYKGADQSLNSIESYKLLPHIKHNADIYHDLFNEESPVISSTFFYGMLDYKALAELINDPDKKLFESLSCDDYTLVERLHLQNQFNLELSHLPSSQFKKDLVELHHHFYTNTVDILVEELYNQDN